MSLSIKADHVDSSMINVRALSTLSLGLYRLQAQVGWEMNPARGFRLRPDLEGWQGWALKPETRVPLQPWSP